MLYYILSFSMYIVAVALTFSKNPVHSVLKLILIFFLASLIMLLFGADFIGLLLVIIYVGAIAVLFLFIIMMLDLKEKGEYFLGGTTFSLFYILFSLVFVFSIYKSSFFSLFTEYRLPFNYLDSLELFSGLQVFGVFLYSYFSSCIMVIGFILLIALLGSIVLTINYANILQNQFFVKQLSRSEKAISGFN